MTSILALGLLLGMKHALEADHVAAVASLADRGRTFSHALRLGAAWGVGHTLTLFAVVSLVLLFDTAIPELVAHGLEMAVGALLVVLGGSLIHRLIRQRVHFHAHAHGGQTHFHAHSHAGEGAHDKSPHQHSHRRQWDMTARALAVGFVHGLAGSAALVVLTAVTTETLWQGMAYTAMFGLGSTAGMAVLSMAIAVPLRFSARRLMWAHNGLLAAVGMTTIVVGATLFIDSGIEAGVIA